MNNQQPVLTTARLSLRPFTLADAATIQRLAGDKEVASTTLNIPHPYEEGLAEQWISTHQAQYEQGLAAIFAITLRAEGTLIGAIGLGFNRSHEQAELGYWIGKPYWNRGYCTEAARAVVQYGFETCSLHRIHASHLRRNPASGRVMQKLGMRREGILRHHVKKWGVFEDLEVYGILKSDFG